MTWRIEKKPIETKIKTFYVPVHADINRAIPVDVTSEETAIYKVRSRINHIRDEIINDLKKAGSEYVVGYVKV